MTKTKIKDKDIAIQKVGTILSDMLLPLSNSTLRFISATLRQAEKGPVDFGYFVVNVLENDPTIPAATLRVFDWQSAVLGFIAMELKLEDMADLCYQPKPFTEEVIAKANKILDIKKEPFNPCWKVLKKAFSGSGLVVNFKKDMVDEQ